LLMSTSNFKRRCSFLSLLRRGQHKRKGDAFLQGRFFTSRTNLEILVSLGLGWPLGTGRASPTIYDGVSYGSRRGRGTHATPRELGFIGVFVGLYLVMTTVLGFFSAQAALVVREYDYIIAAQ